MTEGGGLLGEGLQIEAAHPERRLDVGALEALLRRAAEAEGFEIRYLGIVLTGHHEVRQLNRAYLGHDEETDVLAFPLDEAASAERAIDGEVYVDLDTAAERAPEFGATFEEEARRYALHGLLHLMGHDDATEAGRAAMRRLEDRHLAGPGG